MTFVPGKKSFQEHKLDEMVQKQTNNLGFGISLNIFTT